MRNRERFWLKRFLFLLGVATLFIIVSLYNVVQFNNSYIQEEKAEMDIFKKQIEWVAIPLLERRDYKNLENYAKDFKDDEEFSFRIFDENKMQIISSVKNENTGISQDDKRLLWNRYNILDLYLHSYNDKSLEKVTEFYAGNKKYYLELSLSQEFVISTIVKAQKNIIGLSYFCLFLLLLTLFHIFYSERKEFNALEDSVTKIAKGELDTEIVLPKIGLLSELTVAIREMTYRLKQQILRLTKLEQYRSDFISNLSHEIKTPITAVNSAIELIQPDTNLSELSKECLDIIKNQTSMLNSIVQDILSLAEIDLEKSLEHKKFEEVKISRILGMAISNQGIVDAVINITGNADITILCDENLAVTAISNLLSNAVKYSGSEKIDIIITRNNISTEISIKDYGIGIAQEHLPRIFERFYRVDKARSRKNGGTGLGLAITKNIAELHGWKLSVESETGVGTCFKIII